jgi:hypothetical protein
MARRLKIPGASPETERALTALISGLEDRLAKLEAKPGREDVVTSDTNALPGEFLTFEAPTAGLSVRLPAPVPALRNARVTLCFRNSNPVRIVCVGGTVNRAAQMTNTATGTIECICDGKLGWLTYTGLSATGSVTDAEYVVGAAHASLPNGRVATDSTEIDAELTVPNVITWALRAASVVFAKLQDLTGLSVLGRAANSSGVMAAITATSARQVLSVTAAGNALQWSFPVLIQDDGIDESQAHTISFDGGTNTSATAVVVAGVASVSVNVDDFPLSGLADQADQTALANKSGAPAAPTAQALTGLMASLPGATTISTTAGGIAITGAAASSMTATTGVLNLMSTASSLNCVAGSQITLTAATNITGEATAGDVRLSAPAGGVSCSAGHPEQNPATGDFLCNATSGWCLHAGATPTTTAAGGELSSDTTITIRTNGVSRAVFNAAGDVDWPNGLDFDITGSATWDSGAFTLTAAGNIAIATSGAGTDISITAIDDATFAGNDVFINGVAQLSFSCTADIRFTTNSVLRCTIEEDGSFEWAGDAGDADTDVLTSKGNAAPPVWARAPALIAVHRSYPPLGDASYSITPPAGATWFEWEMIAGGGGGGGADADSDAEACAGGGGQAGGWAKGIIAIVSGNITGAIGGTGAGGNNTGSNGVAGGNTTLTYNSVSYTCTGGAGGTGTAAGAGIAVATQMKTTPGGFGAGVGDVTAGERMDGGHGHNGIMYSNATTEAQAGACGGNGGNGYYGGGGRGGRCDGAAATESGSTGRAPGAGGGGGARIAIAAATGATGGSGEAGVLTVRFYSGPVPTQSAIT